MKLMILALVSCLSLGVIASTKKISPKADLNATLTKSLKAAMADDITDSTQAPAVNDTNRNNTKELALNSVEAPKASSKTKK